MSVDFSPIRVSFVFASHGIGGAEQSMLRLMRATHPHTLKCEAIFSGADNPDFAAKLNEIGVPLRRVTRFDVFNLARCFRSFQTDVAYLFGQIRSWPWILAARLAGVPVVIGAERCTLDRLVDLIGRKLDHYVIDHYISNSHQAARDLIERIGVSAQRVHVVYNGLPVPDCSPLPVSADHILGSPSIMCVANIQSRKGQIYLLQAIKCLRAEYPAIRAVLVGKDLSDGALFEQFQSEGLSDCYTWTGFTSNVRGYLARASVFVLPSLYLEGVPTSILEAMQAGVPVIASDVSGVRELVRDGQTGLLVPPGDVEALAAKIKELLQSADLRDRLCSEAQSLIEEQYTMQGMIDGHVAVFLKALSEKRGVR